MDDYRWHLPPELLALAHRYAYGPIIIQPVTSAKDQATLNFHFDLCGDNEANAPMHLLRGDLEEFLVGSRNIIGTNIGTKEYLHIYSYATTSKLVITCGHMNISLNFATSQLLRNKLQRISKEWNKLDDNY